MDFEHVTTERQLNDLCERLTSVERIAFDTEFVSEFTYRPDLCLIQVEYDGNPAVIDAYAVSDVSRFWQVLVDGDHETVVHAGREEFRFCYATTQQAPKRWFDVQVAAGMVGLEYPISYGRLLQRLLRKTLPKGEARTDWRRRPLSTAQMSYALEDVIHLPSLCDQLTADLKKKERLDWLADEALDWQQSVIDSESRERWRKISGTSGLNAKAQRIVKELWRWRDQVARDRDCPSRRVLRDDLICELAKRGKSDVKQIRAIRGLPRRDLNDQYESIADAVERGIAAQPEPRVKKSRRDYPAQINVLAQFLGTALTSICRRQSISPALVGTTQDVRDLIAYHLKLDTGDETPALATGWRAKIVGQKIEQLLNGDLSLRISDPHSEAPLSFDPVD